MTLIIEEERMKMFFDYQTARTFIEEAAAHYSKINERETKMARTTPTLHAINVIDLCNQMESGLNQASFKTRVFRRDRTFFLVAVCKTSTRALVFRLEGKLEGTEIQLCE